MLVDFHKHPILAAGFVCATRAAILGRYYVGQWHAGEILVSGRSQVVFVGIHCATGSQRWGRAPSGFAALRAIVVKTSRATATCSDSIRARACALAVTAAVLYRARVYT